MGPLARGDRGHPARAGVGLVLEEEREVGVLDFPDLNGAAHPQDGTRAKRAKAMARLLIEQFR